ncbi:MAG: helix-turn-helix transcriptional regulator [Gemmatimonadota bacterium]
MDESTARLLGARIALLREDKGLSLGDLSERTGIAKSYLSRLERGESLNLGLTTLSTIATAFGQTVHDLLPKPSDSADQNAEAEPADGIAFERIVGALPAPLQQFLEEERAKNCPVPVEAVRALSLLKLRGKHPETADDYRLFFGVMQRFLK